MPLIPFPDVPNVPGVPAIPRRPGVSIASQLSLSILQGSVFRLFQVDQKWGIYDQAGRPLGDPYSFTGIIDNVLETIGLGGSLSTGSVDYAKETRVSDFPLERGGFAAYNKVELPATPVVTLRYGGNENSRKDFLAQIEAACKSTELYNVVTPEVTYINYSIERFDYERRASRGATLLEVWLYLKEIRQVSAVLSVSSAIQAPRDPAATPTADSGKVQAKTPDTSTLQRLGTAIQRVFQ